MPESWFELSSADQSEALEVAAGRSGRPAHLLEKDIWVVWTLSAIYDSPLGESLTFKGGTSLSKVYKVIELLRRRRSDLRHPRAGAGSVARWQSHLGVSKPGEKDHQCGAQPLAAMDRTNCSTRH